MLLILLCVFLLITISPHVQGAYSGIGLPPLLVLSSYTDRPHVNDPLYIDISRWLFPESNGTMLIDYDFGDGTTILGTQERIAMHVYTTPGKKIVQVRVSDNTTDALLDGSPSIRSSLSFTVHHVFNTWRFIAWMDTGGSLEDSFLLGRNIVLPSKTISTIYIQAFDPLDPSYERSKSITQQLSSQGEALSISFSNITISLVEVSSFLDEYVAWKVIVHASTLSGSLIMTVRPVGINIMGYAIEPTSLIVSVSHTFQHSLVMEGGVYIGNHAEELNKLNNNNQQHVYFHPRQDVCWKRYGVAVLGIESLVLETFDLYNKNVSYIDLSSKYDFSSRNDGVSPINVTIFDAAISDNVLFLATSAGILQSTSYVLMDSHLPSLTFKYIKTSILAVDGGFNLIKHSYEHKYIRFQRNDRCVAATQRDPYGYLQLVYDHPALVKHEIYATHEMGDETYIWTTVELSDNFIVYDIMNEPININMKNVQLIASVFDVVSDWTLYLLGNETISSFDVQIIMETRHSNLFYFGFQFLPIDACTPLSINRTTNNQNNNQNSIYTFEFRVAELGIYLYSNQIWLSQNGGISFSFVACVPDNEQIIEFTSTAVKNGFLITTESGKLYYGEAFSSHLVLLSEYIFYNNDNDNNYIVESVLFNELGQVELLSIYQNYNNSFKYLNNNTDIVHHSHLNTHIVTTDDHALFSLIDINNDNNNNMELGVVPVFAAGGVLLYVVNLKSINTNNNHNNITDNINIEQTFTNHIIFPFSTSDLIGSQIDISKEETVTITALHNVLYNTTHGWSVLHASYLPRNWDSNSINSKNSSLFITLIDENSNSYSSVLLKLEDGAYWSESNVGMTIVTPTCSFLITSVINSTSVHAYSFRLGFNAMGLHTWLDKSQWILYELNSYENTIEIIPNINSIRIIQTNNNNKEYTIMYERDETKSSLLYSLPTFYGTDVGSIFWINNNNNNSNSNIHWGIIESIYNDTTLIIRKGGANSNDIFPSITKSSNIYISKVKHNVQLPFQKNITLMNPYISSSWSFRFSQCAHEFFSDSSVASESFLADVVYLDIDDTHIMRSYITPEDILLQLTISNIRNVSMNSTRSLVKAKDILKEHYNMTGEYTMELFKRELSIISTNISLLNISFTNDKDVQAKYIDITIAPQRSSLVCRQNSQLKHIVLGCPPSKTISSYSTWSLESFLTYDNINTHFQTLPVNYRPPSEYGRLIPTSNNIYNSDPSKPMYGNFFDISKDSGEYKICNVNKNMNNCGCTDEMRFSEFQADSDCINQVRRVHFNDEYTPRFILSEEGKEDEFLSLPVRLTEVNGRTDYCFNFTDCGLTPEDRATPLYPSFERNHAIVWLGDELYHFKVEVVSGSVCHLVTEFKVYVITPPLNKNLENIVIGCTSMFIGIVLFLGYIAYVRTYGTLSNNSLPNILQRKERKKYEKLE